MKKQSKKYGRPKLPVTLYNLETGRKKTWKTRDKAAQDLGVTKHAVEQIIYGIQKTISGWSLTKPELPHQKRGPRDIKENFQPIDYALLEEWRAIAPAVYELQKKGGDTSCQFVRRIQDADIAESIGVQEINVNQHGADGRKDREILYEHKNQSNDSLDVTIQDLSIPRLEKFKNGILTVGTQWEGFLHKKYSVIFNSKNVGDIIEEGQKNYRKSVTIPLNTLIENGAKVIAWNGDIIGALDDIQSRYPHTKLSLDDIYGPENAKYIANQVMEVNE